MVEEKPKRYDQHEPLPIPNYDEPVSPYQSSSLSILGDEERSNDAERQGLRSEEEQNGYQAHPVAAYARSSLSFGNNLRASTEELRSETITQMDVLEPETGRGNRRGNMLGRNHISKHITSLTHNLSSLSSRQWLPCRDYFLARIPTVIRRFQPDRATVLSRSFALVLVVSLVYLLFFSHVSIVGCRSPKSATNFPDMIREFVRSNANGSSIRQNFKYLTLLDHMAGTKGSHVLGEFVQDSFMESRLEDVRMERFDV